jgi:hypothetical protein
MAFIRQILLIRQKPSSSRVRSLLQQPEEHTFSREDAEIILNAPFSRLMAARLGIWIEDDFSLSSLLVSWVLG